GVSGDPVSGEPGTQAGFVAGSFGVDLFVPGPQRAAGRTLEQLHLPLAHFLPRACVRTRGAHGVMLPACERTGAHVARRYDTHFQVRTCWLSVGQPLSGPRSPRWVKHGIGPSPKN